MSIFAEAYKTGLEAAQEANNNKKEIEAVFNNFSNEILESSNGIISIIRQEKGSVLKDLSHLSQISDMVSNTPDDVSVAMGIRPIPKAEIFFYAILAENKKTSQKLFIGEYELDEKGYPIKIMWADREESCWDKAGLTETLKEMLAHPATGKIFIQLLAKEKVKA